MSCRLFSFHSVVPIILSAACLIPHGEELALTCVPWYAGPRVSILSGTERGISGYWRLNEGPGAMIFDTSSYNSVGPIKGEPRWTANMVPLQELSGAA